MADLSEIDTILQTLMFSLYGNQYDSREEFLLLSIFGIVISGQFHSANDFGSLLRANTPASRLLTTFTRRGAGQAYLKSVLHPFVKSLCADPGLDLEINFQLIQKNSPESLFPDEVQLEERSKALVKLAQQLLDVIKNSLNEVPYGVRYICHLIKQLAAKKFPETPQSTLATLVGAFFMLRFINPAIISPEAYYLVESAPAKNTRRILTLLTKLLQNLVNQVTQVKETYMLKLSSFVEENKQNTIEFLLALGDVPDFQSHLEIEKYLALSRKDIPISISLNEIYQMHSLLLKYRQKLFPKRHIDNITASQQLQLEEFRYSSLKKESSLQSMKIMDNDLNLIYLNAKNILLEIFFEIDSIESLVSGKFDIMLSLCKYISANRRPDPKMESPFVSKARNALEGIRVLENHNFFMKNEGMNKLKMDLIKEFEGFKQNLKKICHEIESLCQVHKILLENQSYLKAQIKSYTDYLGNVRLHAGNTCEMKNLKSKCSQRFSHAQLEKDGIILNSEVPDNRRGNVEFVLSNVEPGLYAFVMFYNGCTNPVLMMNFKLDDLLQKQKENCSSLDLECLSIHVSKTLSIVNRLFFKK